MKSSTQRPLLNAKTHRCVSKVPPLSTRTEKKEQQQMNRAFMSFALIFIMCI
jgi:hypothetical protein